MYVQLGGVGPVDLVQKGHQVGAGGMGSDVGDDFAGGDLQRGEEVHGAVALVVVGGFAGVVGSIGNLGAVRLSAWICGLSPTANTAKLIGGLMYKPTRSQIYSTKSGSGDSLDESWYPFRSC